MKVERREITGHEYVLVLTPADAQRLYEVLHKAAWDMALCNELERALGDACLDQLRRIW